MRGLEDRQRQLAADQAAIVRELAELSDDEQRLTKRQFGMSLANLDRVRIYWRTTIRRITVRSTSVGPAPRGRHRLLPDDALLIGEYAHPFNVYEFLSDLNDRLALLKTEAAAAGAR